MKLNSFSRSAINALLLSVLLSAAMQANAQQQTEEHTIGVMIKALDSAIKQPSSESLNIIQQYGTDSRYYVMIRGWLVQELQGVNSQLAAYRSEDETKARLQAKHDFLSQAIRRIDLE
ncbi:hypothetical protein [Shewanella fidelis]|uniref:Uncharacterized protein n=1 Tax=Shewanella fidelis TaxID=173509 RepID=A0AAW8NKA6_9GAMM|nr:hypothetical protein [Shewanella fidelis]MDR8522219.1 hypothetical protein [Shewanella fidelis]MDW4812565.1 hypothetical protein [Shewanella fidelis]MDW4816313.1 hypothetical protein [Shewanella fidelis]MDW4820806.1 hypothetical protein [Shewanella fidelis]MDW4825029.1 hypothetical protein [Shewanella fidelis]